MENKYYFNKKNPKFKDIELDPKGYPIWKNSGKLIHRGIANKYLRKIEKGEQVHHIDGDKKNFQPHNLIILSKEDHKKIQIRNYRENNLKIVYVLIFLISISLAAQNTGKWNPTINLILIGFLCIGTIIHLYEEFFDKIIWKAKLYKILNLEKE